MLISGWIGNSKILFDLVCAMILRNKRIQRIMLGQINLYPTNVNVLFEVKCKTKVILKDDVIYIIGRN